MKDVLNAKGKMIVDSLLEQLGPKNQNDIHKALNASTVLLEFVDNPNVSPIITNGDTLKKLVQICCQTENNKQNLPYALGLLSAIINCIVEHEKEVAKEKKEDFF
jgi:hypothetical protein